MVNMNTLTYAHQTSERDIYDIQKVLCEYQNDLNDQNHTTVVDFQDKYTTVHESFIKTKEMEQNKYRNLNNNMSPVKENENENKIQEENDVEVEKIGETKIRKTLKYKFQPCSNIDLLYSPKSLRKNISVSTTELSNDVKLKEQCMKNSPSTTQINVPRDQMNKTHDTTRLDRDLSATQNNSYLLSPRVKRKQIDITKSPAYKEIYASNLRLYSAVLAKQIATTSQVGREMDNIRRHRIKQKALKLQNTDSKFPRSKSFTAADLARRTISVNSEQTDMSDEKLCIRRSKSEGYQSLISDITKLRNKMGPQCQGVIMESSSQGDIMESSSQGDIMKSFSRSDNALKEMKPEENLETKSEMFDATDKSIIKVSNIIEKTSTQSTRSRSAALRTEQMRQKLLSFDATMEQTNIFLAKVKTVKTLSNEIVST